MYLIKKIHYLIIFYTLVYKKKFDKNFAKVIAEQMVYYYYNKPKK